MEITQKQDKPTNKNFFTHIDKQTGISYDISFLEEKDKTELSFKMILIGNSSVGKSCLTLKGTKNIFKEESQPTIGFEFFNLNMKINNKPIKLQIWDTCGQESYRSMISNFYRNSGLAVLVYSITSKKSFEDIDIWLKELKSYSSPDIKIIIVGNKSDLEEERLVKFEKAIEYSQRIDANGVMETSAKAGTNVSRLFIEAGVCLYKDYVQNLERSSVQSSSIDTNEITRQENKRASLGVMTKSKLSKENFRNRSVKSDGCCK